MKNSLRIHKWTHNEFNIFILGVLTHPHGFTKQKALFRKPKPRKHIFNNASISCTNTCRKLAPNAPTIGLLRARNFYFKRRPFWSIRILTI